MAEPVRESITKLQLFEQNLQALAVQKQQFQNQLFEMESALKELENSTVSYKIIGNIMVSAKKEDLKNDLQQKKEILELRIKNIEKQENQLKEKAKKLQEEVIAGLKKK